MKNRDRDTIKRQFAKQTGDLKSRRNLFYLSPVGDVLRGLLIEGSSDPAVFYFWTVVQPTFIPDDTVNLTYGFRLKYSNGGEKWLVSDENVVDRMMEVTNQTALPYLSSLESIPALSSHISAIRHPSDPRRCEEVGMCLARAGSTDHAFEEWSRIDSIADCKINWQREVKDRVKHLEQLFKEDYRLGQRQLDDWAAQTRRALKVVDSGDE